MREPSQWNTVIAIANAVLLFTGIFTAMFTALAVAIWTPIAVVRWAVRATRNVAPNQNEVDAPVIVEQEPSYELAAGYAIIQKLARHTSNAWPTTRV